MNVPIGSAVVLASFFILTPSLAEDENRGFDIPGAVTLTAGLVLMVFALVKSTSWGWASAKTLGTLAVAFVLIVLFVVIERRTKSALVPLSIFRNRSLSVSNMVSLALGASIFSMFYFLSLYMQQVLGYSALRTGVGYLAIAGSIIVAAGAAQSLVAKFGVRLVMTMGMALAAGGLIYFAQISPHGTYLGTLLPGFLLAGVGLGLSFVPVTIGAMSGVVPNEAGVASGLITTTQQIGGALGVAVLSTIAVSATTRFIGAHGQSTGPVDKRARLTASPSPSGSARSLRGSAASSPFSAWTAPVSLGPLPRSRRSRSRRPRSSQHLREAEVSPADEDVASPAVGQVTRPPGAPGTPEHLGAQRPRDGVRLGLQCRPGPCRGPPPGDERAARPLPTPGPVAVAPRGLVADGGDLAHASRWSRARVNQVITAFGLGARKPETGSTDLHVLRGASRGCRGVRWGGSRAVGR